MQSILYISESKIEPANAQDEVERILKTAYAWNRSVGITGALMFTGSHFAQVIEGEDAILSQLMGSIARDSRHAQVNVVAREPLSVRRFPDWSMAYSGPSQFVSRHVTRLFNDSSPSENARAASWLAELLEEFAGFRGAR